MFELNSENAVDYLRARGAFAAGVSATAELLGWGVSNVVLRVNCDDGNALVLKQSREKLRTRADWRSRLERVYREAEVQRLLADLLPAGMVPRVLFEDRPNYLYAMQAVDADHVVWKAALLEGRGDETVATTAAAALAQIHSRTAGDETMRSQWEDATVFDELRLDPFYRFTARAHPEIAGRLDALIAESLATRVCLVLGDFSPKNILLTRRGIALVDFETGHFGDPVFDLGFFLSHLLLKAIAAASAGSLLRLAETFWREYLSQLAPPTGTDALQPGELSRRTVPHLAGCLLARIDGKSPVDYLDEARQDVARRFALRLFDDSPPRVEDVFDELRRTLRAASERR
jgi:aminoglycoside phosphotransferase (APT) family kinase protein